MRSPAARFCLVVALAVGATGMYLVMQPDSVEPLEPAEQLFGLVLDRSEIDLGTVEPGERVIVFTVRNRSDQPGQVLGVAAICGDNCCVSGPADPARIIVPPGATTTCPCRLNVLQPAPFRAEFAVFLQQDRFGILRVPVVVRGIGKSTTS